MSDPTAHLVASLQPAQREAVLADDPVVCVLAGAGTGKTRVLTLRVARRIADRSAPSNHVLVCTFSRKAADELRDRLWSLGVGADVLAGTFHRTALGLIRRYRADHAQPPPVVLADRRPLLAAALGDGGAAGGSGPGGRSQRTPHGERGRRALRGGPGGGTYGRDVARADAEIGWAKARAIGPDGYEAAARGASRRVAMRTARVAEVYERYERERRRRGVLDLDDLLVHCAEILESDGAFADAVRWHHRHLYVDEMQDLNDAQFRLLRLLAGNLPDLFVVGDPNQSVYGWNGADPGLLARLPEEFPGTRVIRLEANHRCSPQVVRVAAAVLEPSDGGPVSTRADGPLPRVACLDTDAAQAAWVARQVWLAHRPGRRWSSIAVLARTNAQLGPVADALAAERVPFRTAGSELAPASDVAGEGGDGGGQPEAPGAHRADEDVTEDDAVEEPADAVVLSTFHRAKGLQWPAVFVIGLSDGLVPLVTARTPAAREEEQRLLYVALTRAEDELTCTWAAHPDERARSAQADPRNPSPWLRRIEDVLDELASDAATVADPDRASQHLARMRAALATAIPTGARP